MIASVCVCVYMSPFAGHRRGGNDRNHPGQRERLDHVDLQSFCKHLDSAQSSDPQSLHQHEEKHTNDRH